MAAVAGANIHVFFIPFHARGHTIPLVDTARLFAQRGVRCTVVTTPGNASYVRDAIEHARDSEGLPIALELVPFPAAEAGLPAGVECTDALPPGTDEGYGYDNLYRGMVLLRRPVENLVAELRPDCVVADMFMTWAPEVAAAHSVPAYRFSAISPFSLAVTEKALAGVAHALPHAIELAPGEIPAKLPVPGMMERWREAEGSTCGVMFNCFEELVPEYVEHCGRVTLSGNPMNVWCLGPLRLYKAGPSWDGEIKRWLDTKPPGSVVYVSFGSECFLGPEQLREIAAGLRGCAHPFVWVVRGGGGGAETMDEWMPEGFGEEVGGRGMVVTEWAPQVEILNHGAAGGYVMHCGWSSCVEAVCAGLPVVAWPLHSDHFICERLVVEVLRTGLRLLDGPGMRSADRAGLVRADAIRDAVDRLMGGGDEEARAVRENAKRYKGLARAAMAEGGSSYVNLSRVIDHMQMLVKDKKM